MDLTPTSQRAALVCDAVPRLLSTDADVPEMGQAAKDIVTATVLGEDISREMLGVLWLLVARLGDVPEACRRHWVFGVRTPLDELCGFPEIPCSSFDIESSADCADTIVDALVEPANLKSATAPLLIATARRTLVTLLQKTARPAVVIAMLMAKRIADTAPDGMARERRMRRALQAWGTM